MSECYKSTSGCGVYENRSCSECPYSKPIKERTDNMNNGYQPNSSNNIDISKPPKTISNVKKVAEQNMKTRDEILDQIKDIKEDYTQTNNENTSYYLMGWETALKWVLNGK
jgi:hypothetical protein